MLNHTLNCNGDGPAYLIYLIGAINLMDFAYHKQSLTIKTAMTLRGASSISTLKLWLIEGVTFKISVTYGLQLGSVTNG